MKITWYGHACFKIKSGELVIITDPFEKTIGLNPPRGEADIVTVSHDHYDHNNVKIVKGTPFIIDSPGEYDAKGVAVRGINSFHDDSGGSKRGLNIMFVMEIEEMRICHLGDLGQKELTSEQLDSLGEIDILMIPMGGVYTIGPEEAVRIINQIEPRIVIPMHYKIPGLTLKLKTADEFLKEMGVKRDPVDQLTIKKKDLIKEETEVVVMKTV